MSKNEVLDPWKHGSRYTFSTAVKRGKLLFISGMTASDPNTGRIVGKGDIVVQTKYIYEKIEQILDAAGASFDDIVKTQEYITTTENYKATAEIRREYFKNEFPAATGVIVKGLLRKDAMIEIDVVAVLDD